MELLSFIISIVSPLLIVYINLNLNFITQGSVLNFFLTKTVEDRIGLTWTLWGGAMLCLLGFLAAIVVSTLDTVGIRQLGQVRYGENVVCDSTP